MEKSVPDREEKRGSQDFKSTESLKSGFKDIVLAFKSLGKLKHASFGKKRGFQSSRRIEIAPGFQPCGKLKDVIFDKKLESREIEIVRGLQPCGKWKDVSFDKKRESRRRNEIVGGGKLKDASFDEKPRREEAKESWRREIVSKSKYGSFRKKRGSSRGEIDERGSSRTEIDEEEYQESWNKMRKSCGSDIERESEIDEEEASHEASFDKKRDERESSRSESCCSDIECESEIDEKEASHEASFDKKRDERESSRSEIDEEEYQESWNKMLDEEEYQESWDNESWDKMRKRWGSDIDEREREIDEEEASQKANFDKKRESSRSKIDERESSRSEIDEEEYQESWNKETWNKMRKRWGSDIDESESEIDEEEASEEAVAAQPGRILICYEGGIKKVISEIGRDFEHWRFRVRWGDDGCPCREQMILIYLKWIAKVLGSKEQALKSLLSVTNTYFICKLSRERAYRILDFDGVFALIEAIYAMDDDGKIIPGEYAEEGTRFSDDEGFYRRKLDAELPEDPVAIPTSKSLEMILSKIYAGVA